MKLQGLQAAGTGGDKLQVGAGEICRTAVFRESTRVAGCFTGNRLPFASAKSRQLSEKIDRKGITKVGS